MNAAAQPRRRRIVLIRRLDWLLGLKRAA